MSIRVHLVEGVEKQEDRKNLVFPYVCLVGQMEKWRDGKKFCLVEYKKWEDRKQSLCKFTLMPLLDKKIAHYIFIEKIVYRWTPFKKEKR